MIRTYETQLRKRSKLLEDVAPIIDFYPNELEIVNKKELHVLKTTKKTLTTFQYGRIIACSIELYDPINEWEDDKKEKIKKFISKEENLLVEGKKRFSSDIMVLLGTLRYIKNRTREEVQSVLHEDYSLTVSTGTISNYSLEFLVRVKLYHELHFQRLVEAMKKDGGYVLGVDGTGDGGSNRIILLMDLLKGWSLKVMDVPTENSDYISPLLEDLIIKAGKPLAYVRDMGRGLEKAGNEIIPDVLTRACHFHFLKDVGCDLMEYHYQNLRTALIKTKLQPELKKLRKKLYYHAKIEGIDLKENFRQLQECNGKLDIENEQIIFVEIYHLISWILNYTKDSNGLRFPYSLPWYNFFQRCRSSEKLLAEIRILAGQTHCHSPALESLETLLSALSKEDLWTKLEYLEEELVNKYDCFTQLRTILKLPKDKSDIPREQLFLTDDEVITVTEELQKFKENLLNTISLQSNSEANLEKKLFKQLEKHWENIIVPNVKLIINGEEKTIAIPRTISLADSRFGLIKTSCRKRTGRKDTRYELNYSGVLLCYLENLQSEQYIKIMYNTKDAIPEALATIPKELVDKEIKEIKDKNSGFDITKATGEKEFDDFLKMLITRRENTELGFLA